MHRHRQGGRIALTPRSGWASHRGMRDKSSQRWLILVVAVSLVACSSASDRASVRASESTKSGPVPDVVIADSRVTDDALAAATDGKVANPALIEAVTTELMSAPTPASTRSCSATVPDRPAQWPPVLAGRSPTKRAAAPRNTYSLPSIPAPDVCVSWFGPSPASTERCSRGDRTAGRTRANAPSVPELALELARIRALVRRRASPGRGRRGRLPT